MKYTLILFSFLFFANCAPVSKKQPPTTKDVQKDPVRIPKPKLQKLPPAVDTSKRKQQT